MTALATVFGALFRLSGFVTGGHYLLALAAFTLLTKIILLPVALWTQKNGIKMAAMAPKFNTLKAKYFGDKDKIADETASLYKAERYNPFSGLLPMLLQIVVLLGIIQVVRRPEYAGLSPADMWLWQIDLALSPSQAGGVYLLMPFLAALSAFALGLSQNKLNPLQSVQGKKSRAVTNGISVGISLALAAFVPAAVGFYWIFSNLLTIAQQIALNALTRPERRIDRAALAESVAKLSELESINAGKSRELRRYAGRERADYKRFFSVVNKHIVFYSESNGFYKYLEGVMGYLLEHTNLVIHYITSDPLDNIFKMAEENGRIRAYYIGEKRLITLMMRMDADMVVMTLSDLGNYHIKRSYVRKDVEYVYTPHYPLSTFLVLHNGAFDNYDTMLCVGEFQIAEIRRYEELHKLKAKRLIVTGYCQLEKLQAAYDALPKRPDSGAKKILIAPSWQPDNILDSCLDALLSELLGRGFAVTVRPHPEYVKRYGERMDAIMERYKDYAGKDLRFETDFTSNSSIFESDVVISDWSGTAYEFVFVTGKPAVFVDTPMKVNNPGWQELGIEPMEIALRNEVGIRLNPAELTGAGDKIAALLERQASYIKSNLAIRDKLIANYGHSSEVAGKYIIESLKEKAKNRRA